MALQQWIIDYWAARRAANPAADKEAPLEIPGAVWENPFRQYGAWQPPEWVERLEPREVWRREHARALASEVIARAPQGLIAEARAALDASALAAKELDRLEVEHRAIEEPESEQAALAALVLPKRLQTARKAATMAAEHSERVLGVLRTELERIFTQTIVERERNISREQDEQAAELERQAGDRRLAVVNARGTVVNYLPPPADNSQEPPK